MQRIDVLVTYDVDTTTKAGRSRLRKVAQVCKNFGQRVQFSVFELSVSLAQLESFEAKLLDIINPNQDSLRIYVLHGGREKSLRHHGIDRYTDFDDPLIV